MSSSAHVTIDVQTLTRLAVGGVALCLLGAIWEADRPAVIGRLVSTLVFLWLGGCVLLVMRLGARPHDLTLFNVSAGALAIGIGASIMLMWGVTAWATAASVARLIATAFVVWFASLVAMIVGRTRD